MWTPPPTGFMTIAATRSEETAAVGLTPKKISRMGVMSAPPPMPVSPTVNPTITEASAMDQSMCTGAQDTSTAELSNHCLPRHRRQSVRHVLLRGLDEPGFLFHTNLREPQGARARRQL